MKGLVGATTAFLLMGAAIAQTAPTGMQTGTPSPPSTPAALPTQCGAMSAAPTLPDGLRESAADMHNVDARYRRWAADTEAKLRCRAAEVDAAGRQYQAAVLAYQAQAASVRTASDAYDASVAAFNARGRRNEPASNH